LPADTAVVESRLADTADEATVACGLVVVNVSENGLVSPPAAVENVTEVSPALKPVTVQSVMPEAPLDVVAEAAGLEMPAGKPVNTSFLLAKTAALGVALKTNEETPPTTGLPVAVRETVLKP